MIRVDKNFKKALGNKTISLPLNTSFVLAGFKITAQPDYTAEGAYCETCCFFNYCCSNFICYKEGREDNTDVYFKAEQLAL